MPCIGIGGFVPALSAAVTMAYATKMIPEWTEHPVAVSCAKGPVAC